MNRKLVAITGASYNDSDNFRVMRRAMASPISTFSALRVYEGCPA